MCPFTLIFYVLIAVLGLGAVGGGGLGGILSGLLGSSSS
jgi:hypothetical protein